MEELPGPSPTDDRHFNRVRNLVELHLDSAQLREAFLQAADESDSLAPSEQYVPLLEMAEYASHLDDWEFQGDLLQMRHLGIETHILTKALDTPAIVEDPDRHFEIQKRLNQFVD